MSRLTNKAIQKLYVQYIANLPVYVLMLAIIIFFSIAQEFPLFSIYDTKRILMLFVLLVFSLNVLINRSLQRAMINDLIHANRWLLYAFIILLVLGFVSSLLAQYPYYALQEFTLFLLMLSATWQAKHLIQSGNLQKTMLVVLGAIIILNFWVFLISSYLIVVLHADKINWLNSIVGFAHPRFLNQAQSWVLPIIVILPIVFRNLPRRYHWITWLPIICCWLLLFASAGRGTLLGLIVASVFVMVMFRRHAATWLWLMIKTLLVSLLLYWLMFFYIPELIDPREFAGGSIDRMVNNGSSGRFLIWLDALTHFYQQPLFGIGPQHLSIFEESRRHIPAHPHSSVMQILAEWGVFFFVTLLAVCLYSWRRWMMHCNAAITNDIKNSDYSLLLCVALTASMVTAAVHSMLSGVIVMPTSQLLLIFVLALALSLLPKVKLSRQDGGIASTLRSVPSVVRLILLIVVVMSAGFQSMYSIPQIVTLNPDTEKLRKDSDYKMKLKPRFWLNGKLYVEGAFG